MKNEEFSDWAAERGIKFETIEQLLQYAATPEEMKAASEAIEPAPPVYTLQDIKEMTDDDTYGVSPLDHGFIFVGGCPNGDPIALDITNDNGSVWYIYHGSMHSTPLREVALRVADDVGSFLQGLASDDEFPFDYYDAKEKRDR